MSEGRQLSLESTGLIHEIKERGAAMMEHDIPSDIIDNLIDRYTIFTSQLPDPDPETMDAMLPDLPETDLAEALDDIERSADKQEEWHKYRTNHEWVAKPGGYTNRKFQTDALLKTRGIFLPEDDKEFYHFAPDGIGVMDANHKKYDWGPIPQEVRMLNSAFYAIHKAGEEIAKRTLSIIEDVHPDIHDLVTPESLHDSPVRLLFYHPGQNETLGAGHYDKSVLTFQIAESHEGLRIAKNADSPLEMVRRPADKAVFFPSGTLSGEKIGKYPDSPFQPGWHDIIGSETLNQGRHMPEGTRAVCARWAIIFFVNRANYVQPDKALTHTR